jgi:hypothetical protein
MEIFRNLRLRAGRVILSKRITAVRRMQQGFDLEKVKRVGILWDATYEKDFQHLAALNRQLTEADKNVEVLTWIPGKSVPDRLTGLTYMKFLRKGDLNWAYVPVSDDAKNFMTTKFDLLIDINPSSLFSLLFIAAASPASMKTGPHLAVDPEKLPYDLLIKTEKPFSIKVFLEQVMYYLAMISGPEARA